MTYLILYIVGCFFSHIFFNIILAWYHFNLNTQKFGIFLPIKPKRETKYGIIKIPEDPKCYYSVKYDDHFAPNWFTIILFFFIPFIPVYFIREYEYEHNYKYYYCDKKNIMESTECAKDHWNRNYEEEQERKRKEVERINNIKLKLEELNAC